MRYAAYIVFGPFAALGVLLLLIGFLLAGGSIRIMEAAEQYARPDCRHDREWQDDLS